MELIKYSLTNLFKRGIIYTRKEEKSSPFNKRNEVIIMAGITRVKKSKAPAHIKEWAREMVTEIASSSRFDTYQVFGHKNVVVCIDFEAGKSSIARCSPQDEFDLNVGKAIAYARCRGYAIPKWIIYKTMEEMTNGEKFKLGGKVYTFIGYLKEYSHISGAKIYVISENENDVTRFATMPHEKYEMVE